MSEQTRLELARSALARWEEFLEDPDPYRPVPMDVVGDLVTCTRWLAEDYSSKEA